MSILNMFRRATAASTLAFAIAVGLSAMPGCGADEVPEAPEEATPEEAASQDDSFLDHHICGEGLPDWSEHDTTFVTSPLGSRLHDIEVTYTRTADDGAYQVNTIVWVGDQGTDTWHWAGVPGEDTPLLDGWSKVWTPEARDFLSVFSVRILQGYYPTADSEVVVDPSSFNFAEISIFSGDVEVGDDHVATRTFKTEVPGGLLEWKVRFLPMNSVVPEDEAGDENELCVTHLSPLDGEDFTEQVLCAEWGLRCQMQHECVVEGACDDCTPGPTGLCPEHIEAEIQKYGGADMTEHSDHIIAHIHHGKEPGDELFDGKNIHELRQYHPQTHQDTRGQECHEAKVELGTELILDTAAVVFDALFLGGAFNEAEKDAARPAAEGVAGTILGGGVAGDEGVVELYEAAAAETNEASKLKKAGKVVFQVLGANGFTHVIFDAMKLRYDTHSVSGRWHLAADILVGAATFASIFAAPEIAGTAKVERVVTFVRGLCDVTNLGVDLALNVEHFRDKCRGDNCGNGQCGELDYLYGCMDDCQSDYDYACGNGDVDQGCDAYTGGSELCDAYCNNCNNNNLCEKAFGETTDTCPNDCNK